jgi:hypothetical protein
LLVEALLAARRDPELAEILGDAIAGRESVMTALVSRAQDSGELSTDVSSAAAARFTLMLGLGSAIAAGLGLPTVKRTEWSALIQRVVDAFTPEENQ